jgi:hypothetical protein
MLACGPSASVGSNAIRSKGQPRQGPAGAARIYRGPGMLVSLDSPSLFRMRSCPKNSFLDWKIPRIFENAASLPCRASASPQTGTPPRSFDPVAGPVALLRSLGGGKGRGAARRHPHQPGNLQVAARQPVQGRSWCDSRAVLGAGRGRATGYCRKWLDQLRRRHDNRGTRALNQSLDLGLLRSRH